MINFKQYAGPTFVKVAEYLESIHEPQPNPMLCIGFAAEDNEGNIRALSVIQSLPVIEPFTAQPGYGQHLGKLFEMTQEFIKGSDARRVLMHTSEPAMMRIINRIKPSPWPMLDQFYDWRKAE